MGGWVEGEKEEKRSSRWGRERWERRGGGGEKTRKVEKEKWRPRQKGLLRIRVAAIAQWRWKGSRGYDEGKVCSNDTGRGVRIGKEKEKRGGEIP